MKHSILLRGLAVLVMGGCLLGAGFLEAAAPSIGPKESSSVENPFLAFTKTRWGMSKNEVKRVAQGKRVNEAASYFEYRTKLWKLPCTIVYYFIETKLDQVIYRIHSKLEKGAKYPVADFDRCVAILKQNYGAPGSYYGVDGLPNMEWEVARPDAAGLPTEIELYILPALPGQINVSFEKLDPLETKPSPEAQDLTRTADGDGTARGG